MKFGPVRLGESEGAIVAHTIRAGGFVLKKGLTVRAEAIEALHAAGLTEIVVARLEPGDVGEDEAALRLAQATAGERVRIDPPFTGRANLFSTAAGVLVVDVQALDRVNMVDEALTLATLPAFKTVAEGEMIATAKVIPYGVGGDVLQRALAAAAPGSIGVRPFSPMRVGVISTLLPGLKPSVVDKTLRALEAQLAPAGASIRSELRVDHRLEPLAAAIRKTATPDCDLVIVFGASAITDRRDIIPAAVLEAGGTIDQLGMPVDPGNLLLLAKTAQGRNLLGAPGCARSPKENGFDWVLHRLLAGIAVSPADIRAMGAGGLLMEIISRPQPRAGSQDDVEKHAERLDTDD